ncbi:MAG: phytoene/squalene synthase family protein [Corynebacteriales bacterium]|uniref:Phytoene/squalene synthase family protein n=1 Tax=Williamsia herbipolensis TaxID=1603258 RepID=A0AAU4K4V1_9NOCA|nr:phytoene/squalene synthase family protein [Williamsia herbipolensis]MCX6470654.1 phytoene/squalene synthase family protein [Mycobacteriales bacterium]
MTVAERTERGYLRGLEATATHGRTYYLGTRLLPAARRRGVYALYGFARMVDDIVDVPGHPDPVGGVDAIDAQLSRALRPDPSDDLSDVDEVVLALADTIARFDIPESYFRAFLASMRMDLPQSALFRSRYRTFAEIGEYMWGSAAVIGLQMLPIIGTLDPDAAREPAIALGEAFQLTNFIRDIGEDLDRDRIYLPTDELASFGVDETMLFEARRTGVTPPEVRRALAHCIAVTRARYRDAEPGIALIDPRSRPGIRAAFELYRDILDRIEAVDHQILDHRVVVPNRRRARRALGALLTRR